jgi:hypothetical protein
MNTSIERDAKRVVKLLEILNDPDTGEDSLDKARFLIGARLLKIESEIRAIGDFIDPGWRDK